MSEGLVEQLRLAAEDIANDPRLLRHAAGVIEQLGLALDTVDNRLNMLLCDLAEARQLLRAFDARVR